MAETRTTKIVKSIGRTIHTGEYENLRIDVSFEDTISWETIEERNKKASAVTKHIIADFEQTKNEAMKVLDLTEIKYEVHNAIEDKVPVVVNANIFDGLES